MSGQQQRKSRRPSSDRFTPPPDAAEQAFLDLFRPHCTECGSRVEWLSPDEAVARLGRRTVREFTRQVGAAEGRRKRSGRPSPPRIWVCTSCGHSGAFGSLTTR